MTGQVELVSLRQHGTPAIDGSVPAISADGRNVAFGSFDSQLVPGDTNGIFDVFVRDRLLDVTHEGQRDQRRKASRRRRQLQPGSSADGQQVAFDSIATNLVAGDTNTYAFVSGPSFTVPGQCPDIYLHRS